MKISSLYVFLLMLLPFTALSQPKLPVTNNDLRTNLQLVLSEYSNNFSGIIGEILVENPQTTEFSSTLAFETAEENTIIKYTSNRPMYTWQAVMLTTEDFTEAEKKYKWLFNQLKAMTVNLNNGYSFTLSGTFEAASESRKFSGSVFTLTPAASSLPKVKIEVTMQYYFPEWKVGLTVYEKERQDKERGEIIERD